MTNKACLLTALKTMEFAEVPMPTAGKGQIVIRMEAVGVCGSDVHYYNGTGSHPVTFPYILGHECAGTVTEVGEGVTHLKVGDRVALEPGVPCGECEWCRSGHYNLCPKVNFLATPPYGGCLMNYMAYPARYAFKLPDNVSAMEGALVEPLCIGINAAMTGKVQLGDTVLVCGAGCIGLVSLLAAKAAGAANVIVSDIIPLRLEKAKELGAITVNSKEQDLQQVVDEVTGGRGVDCVLDCAGFNSTVLAALNATRRAGTIVIIGMGNPELNGIPLAPIRRKELVITSLYRYKNQYPITINAIASGKIDVSGIVSNKYSFEDAPEAFRVADEKPTETVKNVIVF